MAFATDMAGNSFGRIFRITTAGESHGYSMGVIIDGCPPGIHIDEHYIQVQLDRRRPGQSDITSPRKEPDQFKICSGVHQGKTTGAPILIIIPNEDARPEEYQQLESAFRPSHADFTYQQKYGTRDHRGGGRSSARETANWVAAGSVARLILLQHNIRIHAAVTQIGTVTSSKDIHELDWTFVDQNPVRTADKSIFPQMKATIEQAREEGDSIGGMIMCLIEGCPAGLGEPVFHKLHADLGHAMLSINACKGFEYGSGFSGSLLKGSEHNDLFEKDGEVVVTKTNHSGGIQGGISNGMPIYFRIAFKPVSTIQKEQATINAGGEMTSIQVKGRHDPCVVPRAVPIVESLAALVLVDHLLMQKIYMKEIT